MTDKNYGTVIVPQWQLCRTHHSFLRLRDEWQMLRSRVVMCAAAHVATEHSQHPFVRLQDLWQSCPQT